MKQIILSICIVTSSIIAGAQPPAGPASKGMNFGMVTSETNAINVDELPALLAVKQPRDIKVKGKVVEVCQAEGCWLRMQTTGGTIMIRMKDHAFFVPVDMNGKTIIADGTASQKETSVATLRHYAEDAGKSASEIAAIKEPKKEIELQAKGILVL